MKWYKGNLHCHSTKSDGKLSPVDVAKYYKEAGFDFLGISDHNQYTPVEKWAEKAEILGIPCCEYTCYDNCHVLAVGVSETCQPSDKINEAEKNKPDNIKEMILHDGIDTINAANGIPVICHPLWRWAYDEKEAMVLENYSHFELCNASPDCNAYPIPGYAPAENIWDTLLSNEHRVFGIASDDAHCYYEAYTPHCPLGGRGWISVRASNLSVESVMNALNKGHFYASTGIVLKKYHVEENLIEVEIAPLGMEKVSFEFIGLNGGLLKRELGVSATYEFTGQENYVRLRMSSTAGTYAWCQPVFLDDLKSSITWTK